VPASIDQAQYREQLEAAKTAFHEAERILPPFGRDPVESRYIYLGLKNYDRCRSYCDAAITLSPDYEYASYRKAQSYDEQNNAAAAKAVIQAGPSPKIPKYKALAEKIRMAKPGKIARGSKDRPRKDYPSTGQVYEERMVASA